MLFYISLYDEENNKIALEADNSSDAVEKLFSLFSEHKETNGENIEYVLTEEELRDYDYDDPDTFTRIWERDYEIVFSGGLSPSHD